MHTTFQYSVCTCQAPIQCDTNEYMYVIVSLMPLLMTKNHANSKKNQMNVCGAKTFLLNDNKLYLHILYPLFIIKAEHSFQKVSSL